MWLHFPIIDLSMNTRFGHRIARFFVMLALSLQSLLTGALSMAQANGVDVSRYICVTPGEALSAESKATARRLARLLGDELPADPRSEEHCQLCTLAQVATLPLRVTLPERTRFMAKRASPRFMPGLVHKPQGPPLGSRGPPTHI